MAHPVNIGYCRAVGYGLNESCVEVLRQQSRVIETHHDGFFSTLDGRILDTGVRVPRGTDESSELFGVSQGDPYH